MAAIREFAEQNPDSMHDVVGNIVLRAGTLSAVDALDGFYRLADFTRTAEARMAENGRDASRPRLPTRLPSVLARSIKLNSNLGLYTNFVNLMDLSALAVPASFRTNGLPFGVTLIGRAFEDGKLATLWRWPASFVRRPEARRDREAARRDAAGQHIARKGSRHGGCRRCAPLQDSRSTSSCESETRASAKPRTAAGYRLYALAGTVPAKPGLLFDGEGAGDLEVEVWEMSHEAFGSFVALIPRAARHRHSEVVQRYNREGFICEPHGLAGATDITSFGGWRAWLASRPT